MFIPSRQRENELLHKLTHGTFEWNLILAVCYQLKPEFFSGCFFNCLNWQHTARIKFHSCLIRSSHIWFSYIYIHGTLQVVAHTAWSGVENKKKIYYNFREDLSLTNFLPGQEWVLHTRCSLATPKHRFPPCRGRGCVQLRDRACVPVWQVLVQVDQTFQVDQPPSTVELIVKSNLL